jgi:hypothetical protein
LSKPKTNLITAYDEENPVILSSDDLYVHQTTQSPKTTPAPTNKKEKET